MVDRLIGAVYQLNIGNGGIPKNPVEEMRVTRLGAVGDNHNDKVHHGGNDKAICIFSLESYQELQGNKRIRVLPATSHTNLVFKSRPRDIPRPGDFGENITTETLDLAMVCVGDLVSVGDVELEITGPRVPCMTVGKVFGAEWLKAVYDEAMQRGQREFLRKGFVSSPKWGKSGFKAKVLKEGLIRKGDLIEIVGHLVRDDE